MRKTVSKWRSAPWVATIFVTWFGMFYFMIAESRAGYENTKETTASSANTVLASVKAGHKTRPVAGY